MLVGLQHSSNKVLYNTKMFSFPSGRFSFQLSVCCFNCFWAFHFSFQLNFVSIVLLQIECLVCSFCFRFIGSVELQIGRRLYLQELGVSASQDCCQADYSSDEEEEEDLGQCGSSSSGYKDKRPLPKGLAQSLMNGELNLPYSDKFSMPPAVSCPGVCGEAYYCRWVRQIFLLNF